MANLARGIDGIPVVASDTERDLLFPSPDTDQRVQIRASGAVQRWDGTAWLNIGGADAFVFDPRRYGAKGDWNQTSQTGTDDTAAFQAMAAAINALGTAWNGHRIEIPAGQYYLTQGITISSHFVTVTGAGQWATRLVFAPTSDGAACLTFNKGAGAEMFGGAVRGIAFTAPTGHAKQKIAIDAVDTSELHLDDVTVHNTWTTAGRTATAPSIGFRFKGREALHTRNLTIAADRPMHVVANPNHAYDFDVVSMTNTYFLIQEATESALLIDSGTYVQNFVFSGSNIFTGGKHGIYFANAGGASTANRSILIENLRQEVTGTTGGYLINIDHNSSAALGVTIRNVQPAFTQSIKLRGINQVTLDTITYSGSTGDTPLDINDCDYVAGRNVYIQSGNSVNFGTLVKAYAVGETTTVAHEPDFLYVKATTAPLLTAPFKTVVTAVVAADSPYQVFPAAGTIRANATAGAITVLTPAAASYPGYAFTVKKVDASGNAVTVDGNGAETIDGAATYALAAQYKAVTIRSNGTNWDIVGVV